MSGDACSFEWLVMVLLKTAYFFGPVLVLVLSRHWSPAGTLKLFVQAILPSSYDSSLVWILVILLMASLNSFLSS